MRTNAYISNDGLYRYWLLREWNPTLPTLAIFGVNPSTADAKIDDPTIRKEMGFASRLGYGALLALNAGAYIATDPRKWRKAADPIGPLNRVIDLLEYIRRFRVSRVVVAWGKNGNYCPEQCKAIVTGISGLYCFGRNNDGTPRHPLMLPYSTPLERYTI